jgi:predicted O-linked N-acetylglucosamine transferase (SPINDLY family)
MGFKLTLTGNLPMERCTTIIELADITARKAAGDFNGAVEAVVKLLQESPTRLADPSAWALLMNQPTSFENMHDHEANVLFVTAVMMILDEACNQIDPVKAKTIIDAFLQGTQFRLTAHSDIDLKELMAIRCRLFLRSSFVLTERDHTFLTPVANKWRPRVGILFRHLRADPETTSLLPFFSHAKKSGIEIILFVAEKHTIDEFGQQMIDASDNIIHISQNLTYAVETLRSADLDILVYGNDITAKLSLGACLSFHRVARRAICTVSTLVSPGSGFVDEYFGDSYHIRRGATEEFAEHFVPLPAPGFAFNFGEEKSPSKVTINRSQLGLSENTVLFVSGANHTKLHGPVLDTWGKILHRVPNSALFLYPFPPHFGRNQDIVFARIRSRLEGLGLDTHRIIILPQLPGRNAVKSLLQQMDIGLDSFPYPGVTTIVDAIESHLPTVTLAGKTLRSSQGAAVLASIGFDELITTSIEQYMDTAVALANSAEARKSMVARMRNVMAGIPPFFDDARFGRAAVHEYFRIHDELRRETTRT